MEKIITVLCIFMISTTTYAFGESCRLYKIRIKNEGATDCVLKKQYVFNGKLTAHSKIPDVIFRDQEEQFEMTEIQQNFFLDVGFLLTYECGDNKEITFFSETPHGQKERNAVVESNNVEASFQASGCNNFYGTANKVTWILKP
ncbi:MAG: hypothetical protein NXI01_06760 [Gammaproteobacteria bacterium]|nr:hypothetical protein [Gammaproteobacteria bacterium]